MDKSGKRILSEKRQSHIFQASESLVLSAQASVDIRPFKMATLVHPALYITYSELSCQPSQCISHHLAGSVPGPQSLSISPQQPVSSARPSTSCLDLLRPLRFLHAPHTALSGALTYNLLSLSVSSGDSQQNFVRPLGHHKTMQCPFQVQSCGEAGDDALSTAFFPLSWTLPKHSLASNPVLPWNWFKLAPES